MGVLRVDPSLVCVALILAPDLAAAGPQILLVGQMKQASGKLRGSPETAVLLGQVAATRA